MNKLRKKISFLLLISLFSLNFSYSSFADDEGKVTKDEISKVESEVVKLQSNLFNSSKTTLESLMKDFNKLSKYEEKGNSKFNFSFDEDTFIGNGSGYLNLNNYTVKNSLFDSEMSGNIDIKTVFNPITGTGFNLDLSSFASFISKDSDIYLLLKDLNFNVSDKEASQLLEALKSSFQDGKYLKIPATEESKMALNYLKNLDLNSFLNGTEEILKSPLLTTYKKDGDKYLLVPTKYACETYFNLENKFNTGIGNSFFTPRSCTDTVYRSFLGEFVKSGSFYMILGDDYNTLGFEGNENDTLVNFSINYNDTSILKFDFILIPDLELKNEIVTLNYEKNNYLKFNLNSHNGVIKINFDSKLDLNNNFLDISSDFNFDNGLVGKFELKNKRIDGFFYFKDLGYDYNDEDFKYVLKNVYGGKVTGTLNDDNTLNTLNFKLAGVGVQDKKAFLLSNLNIVGKDIDYTLKLTNEGGEFNVQSNGKYDENYFKLDSIYNFSNDYLGAYDGKLDLEFDAQNNKNNGNINFELNNPKKNLLKLNFTNDALREYKDDINIEAPSDYKELDPKEFEDVLSPGVTNSPIYDKDCPEGNFCGE